MSQPPADHGQPQGDAGHDPDEIISQPEPRDADPTDGSADAPRGRRRGLLIGAGVLVVALIGGGVAVAASKLGGGGAQPDEVVPASAVAFLAVDLDPSAGQKVDALRFLRKFPDTASALKGDNIRKALFEQLKKSGDVSGDWAADVEPWLGDRAGMAVLPPAKDGEDPAVVVVLSVTDRSKAEAGIKKVSQGEATCEYTADFAVCADDREVAQRALRDAEKNPLSKQKTYTNDMADLGEQGVARAWFDLGKLGEAVPSSGGLGLGALTGSALSGSEMTGRTSFALRFDGAALELAGHVVGMKTPKLSGTVAVDDLPADSIAALGIGDAGALVDYAFKEIRGTAEKMGAGAQVDASVQQLQDTYGIAVPGDLSKALGEHTSVVFGGVTDAGPQVAARLSGDRGTIDKLVNAAGTGGLSIAKASAGDDTVLASSQSYADAVAKGSGLGSDKSFISAVPDAKDANSVLYVNIAGLLSQLQGQFGLGAEQRANLAPLSAFGLSVNQDGDSLHYTARLTTK